ncbi:MAG: hypothetical protein AUI83_16235, partial [Armatimonadetes bacterium 13_1_40CM_3_65_7]
RHERIPWPRPLRKLQKPIHKVLGGQRPAALKVGLFGAYLGRGAMLLIASWVIQNRWLLLLGGLYLIKLAADHLGETPQEARITAAEVAGQPVRRAERGFWSVVLAAELADVVFSLDNVVAAVALSRELWVVLTGVFLGIVTMRFAAGIFTRLIERYPVLETAAYILVFNIGVELLLEDLFRIHISDVQKFAVSLSTLILTLLYGQLPVLQRLGRRMRWVKRALGFLDLLFIYTLKPAGWVIHGLLVLLRAILSVL